MNKANFSALQRAMDKKGVFSHIEREGSTYALYINYREYTRAKTRVTIKRRFIDYINKEVDIKINRYQ